MIISEMSVESPLEISLNRSFNPDSGNGVLTVIIRATGYLNFRELRLRMVLIESGLYYDGPNGTDWHNQVFRDMLPDAGGIVFNIHEGELLEFNQDFACRNPLVPDSCDLIAFVQSDNDKRILQAAKIPVIDTPFGIPTLSGWGRIILTLLIIAVSTAAIINYRRRIVMRA